MNRRSKQESRPATKKKLLLDDKIITVEEITASWGSEENLKKCSIFQVLNVDIKYPVRFDIKRYLAELEALGIPAENVGIGFCG